MTELNASEGSYLPEYCRFIDSSSHLSETGLPIEDFGYAVKIAAEGLYTLTDSDMHHFLHKRWQPLKKEDFPVSYHNKNGMLRPRSLNSNHLQQFPWLAVSRLSQFEGAWCAVGVLLRHQMKVVGGVAQVSTWVVWCKQH